MSDFVKKNRLNYMFRNLVYAFLSSILQSFIFATFYIIYIYYSPLTQFFWGRLFNYFAVPSLMGVLFWVFAKGLKNHFRVKLQKLKRSKVKLFVRILAVLCFILIGLWLGKNQVAPTIAMNWLNKFGEAGEFYSSSLTNFSIYLIVSIFPIVYASMDYLFVADTN